MNTTVDNEHSLALPWYRRWFQRTEDDHTRERIAAIRQVALFQNLPRAALRELAEAMHRRLYRRDEYLYYESDPGLGLYIVQSGRVRLLAEDEEGEVYELRQVNQGEHFGELSLFGEFRRMETAQSTAETCVLGLFRPDLSTIVKRSPKAGAAIVLALAQHLAERQAEIIRMHQKVCGKVAGLELIHGASFHVEDVVAKAPPPTPETTAEPPDA